MADVQVLAELLAAARTASAMSSASPRAAVVVLSSVGGLMAPKVCPDCASANWRPMKCRVGGGTVRSKVMAINHFVASSAETPFGGVKDSGFGREGGVEGLQAYTVVKNVSHLVA